MTINELIERLKQYNGNMVVNVETIDFTDGNMVEVVSGVTEIKEEGGKLIIFGELIPE